MYLTFAPEMNGRWARWYDALARLDRVQPVMIAESASAESGGDKAAWITSAFTREVTARTPRVQTVVWFDVNKETDWRVESSAQALNAYRAVATSQSWAGVRLVGLRTGSSHGPI